MVETYFTIKVIEKIIFWILMVAVLAVFAKEKIGEKLGSMKKLKENKNNLRSTNLVFNPMKKKIQIQCPYCYEKLKMDFGYAIKKPLPIGKKYQCPKCNEWFIVRDFEGEEECTANTEK